MVLKYNNNETTRFFFSLFGLLEENQTRNCQGQLMFGQLIKTAFSTLF